jgi:outer membrane protein TolC
MKKTLLLIYGITIFLGTTVNADIITLDSYLKRVEAENPDIISVNLSIEAAWQKVLEADMVYSPFVSGSFNRIDDRSGPGFGSILATDRMVVNELALNASEKFKTGTNVSLGYTYTNADINLLAPFAYNGTNYTNLSSYQLNPTLNLSQSLLRDFNSGLTQAGIDKAKSSVMAGQYMLLYKKQQLMIAARSAYWNLALDREVIEFRKSSLDRAEKLLKWNENKKKLDLVEESDLLQTQAAYKLRQLNLQLSNEDEVKASREFNGMLGLKSDVVADSLEKISDKVTAFSNIDKLVYNGKRADVLAAESSYRASELADRETRFRAMPELSLNASYALNGLDLNYSGAWNQVSSQDKPTYSLGLSFIVPLDYKTLTKVKKGYNNDFASAKETIRSAMTSAQNDWDQLETSWVNVKSRLELAKEIMKIQDARVKAEQRKFEKGRTTTFLMLSAENDLDDAILSVYRTVFEEMMTLAQAELFNTKPINNK